MMQIHSKIDHPEIVANIFPQRAGNVLPHPCPAGAEDVGFTLSPGLSLSCRFFPTAMDAPVVLFFPSPSSSLQAFDVLASKYNEQNISVFCMSYRGLMGNEGIPSVTGILGDGELLFSLASDWLHQKGYTGAIFLMGHSFGSACAINIVNNNPDSVKGLIVESGIGTTSDFLQAIGVPAEYAAFTEEDGFDIIDKIEKIKLPTLIFHGAKDSLVSVAQAEILQACCGARSKQFFVIPGAGRDDLPKTGGDLYFQTIKKYIDTVCGVNTWRQRRRSFKNKG